LVDFQLMQEVGIWLEMYWENNFMKRFITKTAFALACVLTLSSASFASPASSASAANGDGNKEIKASFARDFQSAEPVSTEVRDSYTKVVFKLNQQVMTAFYSNNGELMAVTRNIVSSQLPVSLLMNLKKRYSEYWITDLFEMSQDQESSYYVTVENSDSRTTMRSNGDSWELYSNVKK